jgi:hypothetical protein
MFYGWVNQIILSEVLDVPTSIETHIGGGALNFYDKQSSFAYPKKAGEIDHVSPLRESGLNFDLTSVFVAPYDALYKANEVGDCRNTDEPCAHFM